MKIALVALCLVLAAEDGRAQSFDEAYKLPWSLDGYSVTVDMISAHLLFKSMRDKGWTFGYGSAIDPVACFSTGQQVAALERVVTTHADLEPTGANQKIVTLARFLSGLALSSCQRGLSEMEAKFARAAISEIGQTRSGSGYPIEGWLAFYASRIVRD